MLPVCRAITRLQCIYSFFVIQEGDIRVTKALERIDGLYHLDAEVSAHFVDFNNCQALSNFLVEKLDETVRVSPPEFYHGPQTLENLR